jgi:hypothetical protein
VTFPGRATDGQSLAALGTRAGGTGRSLTGPTALGELGLELSDDRRDDDGRGAVHGVGRRQHDVIPFYRNNAA